MPRGALSPPAQGGGREATGGGTERGETRMGAVLSRPPKRGLNTHRRAAIGLRQYAALVGLLAQANTPDLAGALQYPNAHRPIAA